MALTRISLPMIEKAIREVVFTLEEKNYRLPSWTTMAEDDLWRELVACILGSRVRFEVAHSAVERMQGSGLFFEPRRSSHFDKYELDVVKALSEVEEQNGQARYPFFRLRGKQIRLAAERLYGGAETILTFLKNSGNIRQARRRLALEVPGLGPKQASLFLRNIGYTTHIAVLDAHVLTYMSWVGLTDAPVRTVATLPKYEALEDAFMKHAYSFGCTPDRFDLAVWVVLRVIKEGGRTWA